jgi:hypothetical protein
MNIEFTQYLLPDGRTKLVTIDRPDEIAFKAQSLIDAGCKLEIEMLTTGEISMSVEREPVNDDDDGVLAMEICFNGPDVPVRVDKMINAALAAWRT